MRILHQSDNQLVLQHRPFASLVQGIALLAMGISYGPAMGQELGNGSGSIWLVALALISLGIGYLLCIDWVTCTADRPSRSLTIRRRGLLRDRQMRCSVEQIRWVEVYGRRYKYRLNYKLRLLMYSGKALPLMSAYSWSEANTREMARHLSQFMDLSLSENVGGSMGLSFFSELFGEIR